MMIVNEELKKAYEGIEDDLELVEYEGFYNHIKEWNFIKNYITNLQQENARLKDKIKKGLEELNKTDYEYSSRTEYANIIMNTKDILKEN